MDNETLLELLRCHSTPGDEGEVAALLAREWQDAGWSITRHGAYAVSARRSGAASRRPRLLITAHMDSPGFTVERRERKSLYVLPLGFIFSENERKPSAHLPNPMRSKNPASEELMLERVLAVILPIPAKISGLLK